MLEPAYPLTTERLLLRPFTPDDLEAIHAMRSSPDVARYMYWEPHTLADSEATLAGKLSRTVIAAEGDNLGLAAERKDTGEVVGDFSLFLQSREHRQCEIGFIVHPRHQRRGYATEAAAVLLRLAFEGLLAHRVTGRLEARNAASAGVLERLGMRREAHLVENEYVKGEWQSEVVYALLDREWRG